MAESKSSKFKPNSDVHITLEDQQKINTFARLHAISESLKNELKAAEREKQNLSDAMEELELADEDDVCPFFVGEIFLHQKVEDVRADLNDLTNNLNKEIATITKKAAETSLLIPPLKSQLYAKLGNHINLEPEED